MIRYDEASKSYISEDDGEKYGRVTEMLHAMHLAPDYTMVDEATLARAAERGNRIHEKWEGYFEQYGNFDDPGLFASDGIAMTIAHDYVFQDAERIVADEEHKIAGRYDMLFRHKTISQSYMLVDIKTTAQPPLDYCGWQLSCYRMMAGLDEATPLMMLWQHKEDERAKLMKVRSHKDEEIRILMDAWRDGKDFVPGSLPALVYIEEIMQCELADKLAQALKQVELKVSSIKGRIREAMLAHGFHTYEQSGWRFVVVDSHKRKQIDAEKLKREWPSVYADTMREVDVKSSLRIERVKS